MKLYTVTTTHFSQKDSHDAIAAYLLAKDEEAIVQWVDAKKYGVLKDWENELEDGPSEDEDDLPAGHGEVCPTDQWWTDHPDAKERAKAMGLRLPKKSWGSVSGPKGVLFRWWRGDFEEPEDLYYGATHYRWEAGRPIEDADAAVLLRLNIAEKV